MNDLTEIRAYIKAIELEDKKQNDHISNLLYYKDPVGACR